MKDTIYRQDAIDACLRVRELRAYDEIEEIKALPSAEPVIHCKDCKWWGRVDKRRFYRGSDCLRGHLCSIVPDRDFCSRVERREDETD